MYPIFSASILAPRMPHSLHLSWGCLRRAELSCIHRGPCSLTIFNLMVHIYHIGSKQRAPSHQIGEKRIDWVRGRKCVYLLGGSVELFEGVLRPAVFGERCILVRRHQRERAVGLGCRVYCLEFGGRECRVQGTAVKKHSERGKHTVYGAKRSVHWKQRTTAAQGSGTGQ